MSKTLIIAEKPSLARHIMEMLSTSFGEHWVRKGDYYESSVYYISSFFGHLLELVQPSVYHEKFKAWNVADLPILPEKFRFIYKKDAKSRGKLLSDLSKKVDLIINATDPDREGEGIFRIWYEYEHITTPTKRLWATSLALKDLTKAWKAMVDGNEYDNLYNAQRCRMESDWLVGMNASRAYSIASQQRIAIGRVQTPTLALIVQRDREVEEFKETFFYTLIGNWENIVFNHIKDKETKFDSFEYVETVKKECTGSEFALKSYSDERKKQNPPKPFSMPDLQREANKVFGLSLDKTLKIAQSLYEKKITTYPRTDSPYLPPADIDAYYGVIDKFADENQKELIIPKGECVPCIKKTNASHTAIIPTGEAPADLSEDEKKVFALIKDRFITAFMKPRIFDQTIIFISDGTHDFRSILNFTVEKGFTALSEKEDKGSGESDEQEYTRKIEKSELEGKHSSIQNLSIQKKKKAPPKYFTPATLLTAMINVGRTVDNEEDREILKEVEGLGTAATRDKIPVDLHRRGFIEYYGKTLRSTVFGRKLIAWVREELKSPVLTAEWEKKLKAVNEGSFQIERFRKEISEFIRTIINVPSDGIEQVKSAAEKEKIHCPKCKEVLKRNDFGLFCTEECGFKFWRKMVERIITDKEMLQVISTGKSEILEGFKKKGTDKTFSARVIINAPDYKPQLSFDFTIEKNCPICGSSMKEFSKGIKCDSCEFVIWKDVLGKKIKSDQIEKLIKNGRTDKIRGFKSIKNGKKFDAYLVVDKNRNEVVFNFK